MSRLRFNVCGPVVIVTDAKTGAESPMWSLGCTSLLFGTYSAAHGTVLGAIPFAVEGAVKSPPWLRVPVAASILRTGALGTGKFFGVMAAVVPGACHVGELAGLDGYWRKALSLFAITPGFFWAANRWVPKGYSSVSFMASSLLVQSAMLMSAAYLV
ncbi:hypothetical protein C8R44DRAFT_749837 [Mycena epipterygia]|nr:hypothetical protein C8R44DRAFT_749837 [Mycena epipterygia]